VENLIVVIEDDRDILDIIQFILTNEGFEVIGCDHLLQLESIILKQPSVILLDDKLADGYGNTLCLELKSNPLTKSIPVILLSASNNLDQIVNACHADAFLNKPFDLRELVKLVKRYNNLSLSS
jgi:DNA-binding response OmpR family regulator